MLQRTSIVRWTGKGSIRSLESMVRSILTSEGQRVEVRMAGHSLLASGTDPVWVASALTWTPGVAWIAVGLEGDVGEAGAELARKFLREKGRFEVVAETTGEPASDAAGEATAAILGAVKGSRVDTRNPNVVFRVSRDEGTAAVGVLIRRGPGGSPIGSGEATCLVSGGRHSAVVAWQALLSGLRIRLVHGFVGDSALREVAKLYVELVSRVGEGGVTLEVVGGATLEKALASSVAGEPAAAFVGSRVGGGPVPASLRRATVAPLFLLTDAQFDEGARSLSLRDVDTPSRWTEPTKGDSPSGSFTGWAASVGEVVRGLRRRPRLS